VHVNVGNIFAAKLIDKNSPCAVNVYKEAIVACPVEGTKRRALERFLLMDKAASFVQS